MPKVRTITWKYTLGADWSGHSEQTRRSVEQLLAELAHRSDEPYIRDYASPIGRFVLRRAKKPRS